MEATMPLAPTTLDWDLIDEAQYFLTDEDEEKLRKQDALERKAARRLQRLQDCGRWSYYFDAHNGNRTAYVFKCKLFRDCDKCRKDRAHNESYNIRKVSLSKPMIAIRTTTDEATKMLRGVDKEDYVRYPQENYDLVIINKEIKEISNSISIDTQWMSNQNWELIVSTPEGRNKSGQIHLPKPVEDDRKFDIVATEQIVSDAPREVVQDAMDEAIRRTAYLDPKDIEGIEHGLHERLKIAKRILRMGKYSVNTYQRKQKVIIENISWKNSCSITQNPTSRFVTKIESDAEKVPI